MHRKTKTKIKRATKDSVRWTPL